MREYEVTIVLQPQVEEEARSELIERVSEWLAPGAEEDKKPVQNHWGSRQLAYPIKNFTEGYYVLYEATIDPERLRDIERNIQYTDDILRYLIVRKE